MFHHLYHARALWGLISFINWFLLCGHVTQDKGKEGDLWFLVGEEGRETMYEKRNLIIMFGIQFLVCLIKAVGCELALHVNCLSLCYNGDPSARS